LHLISGHYPVFRVYGELQELKEEELLLNPDTLEKLIMEILNPIQKEKFEKQMDVDIAYSVDNERFRINIHQQSGGIALAARHIPSRIPSGEELGFADVMYTMTGFHDGLILVTGPTGSGKSSTLSSMINYIHQERKEHIITLEDPIEFVYAEGQSIIEQREIGTDSPSFISALKYILRQDPNVILVGEMRDLDTMSATLTAAETGHLVLSTLHTYSAAETIERIISIYPAHQEKQLLTQLSSSLRAVISQQLLPRVGGGRIAIREIMLNNPAIANLIRQNKIAQIPSVIQTSGKEGMITMKDAVTQAFENELITDETYQMVLDLYLTNK